MLEEYDRDLKAVVMEYDRDLKAVVMEEIEVGPKFLKLIVYVINPFHHQLSMPCQYLVQALRFSQVRALLSGLPPFHTSAVAHPISSWRIKILS